MKQKIQKNENIEILLSSCLLISVMWKSAKNGEEYKNLLNKNAVGTESM